MTDGADDGREERLRQIVSESATAAMHCLAAAERAVLDGRFNIAKVLRACAHSTRLTALTAARILAREGRPVDAVARTLAVLERQPFDRKMVSELLADRADGVIPTLPAAGPPSAALEDILQRALMSLASSRDVLESDVAQSLWGCQVCGALFEGPAPTSCFGCGALRFEFEWFGPFYSGTFERLGRRSPAEIVAILEGSHPRLASLLDGIDEEQLARRPSANEWGMKEIAGHLVDVTELFSQRARTVRNTVTPPSLDGSLPPWRLLEGKRYPDVASTTIVEGFRRATSDALALIDGFSSEDWGRFGLIRGRATTILDLGTWLANHNIAHFAQIDALRSAG
jgi:hypothetical protein